MTAVIAVTIIVTACGPITTKMTDDGIALNHHSLLPLKAVILTLPWTAGALLLLLWIQILDQQSRIESPDTDIRIEVVGRGRHESIILATTSL